MKNTRKYTAKMFNDMELHGNEDLVEKFEEQSLMDFKKWKHSNALDALKPKGHLLKFYIDGVQQFMNDSKRN